MKEAERKQWKLNLVRLLYERGYSRKDILELFRFIDWLMVLPEDLENDFWKELTQIEEDKKMPYVTSVERIGIRKGMQQGEIAIIKRQLNRRFGQIPEWVEKRLEQATPEYLELWADRIADRIVGVDSLNEIFE